MKAVAALVVVVAVGAAGMNIPMEPIMIENGNKAEFKMVNETNGGLVSMSCVDNLCNGTMYVDWETNQPNKDYNLTVRWTAGKDKAWEFRQNGTAKMDMRMVSPDSCVVGSPFAINLTGIPRHIEPEVSIENTVTGECVFTASSTIDIVASAAEPYHVFEFRITGSSNQDHNVMVNMTWVSTDFTLSWSGTNLTLFDIPPRTPAPTEGSAVTSPLLALSFLVLLLFTKF